MPRPQIPDTGGTGTTDEADADETTVLPAVTPDADETAVLPPVRDLDAGNADDGRGRGDHGGQDPADRVPPGYFRDEPAAPRPDGLEDRTRELPQVPAEEPAPRRGRRNRRRPDWAEETPLDDLPTLADELLGPRDDEDDGGRRRS
jgi:dTMP kinase